MKRLHPITTQRAWVLTLSMTIYLVGCNNQQMAASNPFMSPDRVPPPATRTIAPGQAAPYYPGDPMPAAQAVPLGAPAVAQAQPITPIGTTMPSPVTAQQIAPQQIAAQPSVAAPTASAAMAPTTSTPQPLAFSNERNVAIPTDNEQLRFAVPPPPQTLQPQPQQLSAQAMPTAATNPMPAAAPAPASQVMLAAFNQPVPAPTTNPDTNGPWRSPQIAANGSQVAQAQYVQAQPGQPTMITAQPAPQTMPVEMRTVPSPQTNPLQVAPQQSQLQPQPQQFTSPPRMRFPSWTDPTTWFTPTPEQGAVSTQPQPGQQLIGYMVPGPNGQMQMVPLDQYQKMQAGTTQQSSAAGSDGFRPRTTTK